MRRFSQESDYTSVDPKYIFGARSHSVLDRIRIASGKPGRGITKPDSGQEAATLRFIQSTLAYVLTRQTQIG